MARGMNHVRLAGAVATSPELRYTPAGLAVLEVTLAGDDHLTGADGTFRALPWYHRVTLFGAQAERYAELAPGTALLVEGRLDFRSWDSDAGERRNALDVVGLRAELLDTAGRGDASFVSDAKDQPRLIDAVNEVTIIGNTTRDAEPRATSGGHSLSGFGVAVNERFRPKGGGDKEKVHFIEVRAWRDLAERCSGLAKGTAVFVQGRLVTDSWEDDEGRRRFATRVEAARIERLTWLELLAQGAAAGAVAEGASKVPTGKAGAPAPPPAEAVPF